MGIVKSACLVGKLLTDRGGSCEAGMVCMKKKYLFCGVIMLGVC